MMDTPTMAEAIGAALESRIADIMTARPGRVVSVTGSTVDVQPAIWPGGDEPPVIPSVPVAWLRAGTAYVTLPITIGTTGLLIACDSDIAEWRRTGEHGTPADQSRHHLQSAVFLPGLGPSSADLAIPVAEAVVAGGPTLSLGAPGATEHVICGNDFVGDLGAFLDILATWAAALAVATGVPDTITPAVAIYKGVLLTNLSSIVTVAT